MNTRILAILPLIALHSSCERRGEISLSAANFSFNNVKIELPNNGIGAYGVSPYEFEYRWEDKELYARDLRDETLSVTTPTVKERIISKDLVIVFDNAGNVSTRAVDNPAETKKPNKPEMATPRKPSD